ncbi:MAG: hypothetical protein NVSMB9_24380 [Isosphaeraceae bacterium]
MNDDIERALRQVTPRGASTELRSRVLAAVADELKTIASPRRRSPGSALAVAASLLVSLALNYQVNRTLDRRLAIVLGPIPVPKQAAEIAADIAAVSNPSTGQWVYAQLASSRPPVEDPRRSALRLQQMIRELTVDLKEPAHETPRKNPRVDRDLSGSRDRAPALDQCVLRLEHWNTA